MEDEDFKKEIERIVMERQLPHERQVVIEQRESSMPQPEHKPEKNEQLSIKRIYKSIIVILVVFLLLIIYLTNNQTDSMFNEIQSIETELSNTNSKLIDKVQEITIQSYTISSLEDQIQTLELELEESNTELEQLKSGNKYEIHDPTYSEVVVFMSQDQTNTLPYDDEIFNCADYSSITNNNAENQGIRCCVISLYFHVSAHQIIGFNTTDRGMIYYEPQTDERVENLEMGKQYWTECIKPNPGYDYTDAPDDTIKDIFYYW